MMIADSADSTFQEASSHLENAKADQIAGNAALNGEQMELTENVKRLESERMVTVNAVPADDRALYDRLRTKMRGVAVASAANRSCSACGTTFSAALYQAARSPAKISHCDTCGRILYAD